MASFNSSLIASKRLGQGVRPGGVRGRSIIEFEHFSWRFIPILNIYIYIELVRSNCAFTPYQFQCNQGVLILYPAR